MTEDLARRMRIRSRPFALVVVLFALLGCTRSGPCVAIVSPEGTTRATVSIEVANTIEQRERGLMFRKHLDDDAKPETDTLRGVDALSQFVLEVNGGFCAKHQIKPGDHFNFQNFFPHASE